MKLTTTLNKISFHSPHEYEWKKLLSHLEKKQGDDEPLDFLTILESNGFEYAMWCMRSAPEYDREWRLFAVWCASQVKHLMDDERSINALDVAERFANGMATQEEFDVARAASIAASRDDAARYADRDAAMVAAMATSPAAAIAAARCIARDAASDSARDAASFASIAASIAEVSDAAMIAARYAARAADVFALAMDAARNPERENQIKKLTEIFNGENK